MDARYGSTTAKICSPRPWILLLPGYLLYSFLTFLAIPFSIIRQIRRKQRRLTGAAGSTRVRGGTPIPHGATVIEANGMGEARVGLEALRQIQAVCPNPVVLLIQKDPAVEWATKSGIPPAYPPAHNPISTLIFLLKYRPKELIYIETSSNYHLAFWARVLGIKSVIIGANVSAYLGKKIKQNWLGVWRYNLVHCVLAQGETYAKRLVEVGVWPEIVSVGGISLSEEIPSPEERDALRTKWRETLGLAEGEQLIVAGSTYPEDEAFVEAAFSLLPEEYNAVLLVAPRHANRAPYLKQPFALRSQASREGKKVIVLDTSGELSEIYAAASVAFIGGTLDEKLGGHTPVEPLLLGCPITFGSEYGRQEPLVDAARLAGVGTFVKTPEDLFEAWARVLNQPETQSRRAREFYEDEVKSRKNLFKRLYQEQFSN
jgi:3-deoxy-D-manno-octulosonic-acid transferase